ncbi:hypothetical protein TPA0908_46370 [Micromonospora sp. AKA38]|nr:hypothetical protein TPA0908_46370 [Micromonospora sp. AKA38]
MPPPKTSHNRFSRKRITTPWCPPPATGPNRGGDRVTVGSRPGRPRGEEHAVMEPSTEGVTRTELQRAHAYFVDDSRPLVTPY